MSIENGKTLKEWVVISSLALASITEILWISYLTIKEIFKKTGDTFVLKDKYTIYFVTLVIMSLGFKVLVMDTLVKNETNLPNSCSMFLSTFVPEFFLILAYTCIAIKSGMLLLTVKSDK